MDSTSTAACTLPPRHVRGFAFVARFFLWLVIAAWLLLGASWAVLHGWIVPRIGEFRPRLEQEASKALGMPVRIGQITAQSGGMIPSFELRDVVLMDPQGREALRLPRILAAFSPSSLWGLGFEQLYIDKPELEIRRTADGKVHVGGLDVSQSRGDSHEVADWFFSQKEFVIRGGSVHWTDELKQAPTLTLADVDWVVRNGRRSHAIRLDATPPPEWGERFTARGLFRQPLLSRNAGSWRDWSGQVFAEFNLIDVSQIRRYASLDNLGIDLSSGRGGLRAWADVDKGKVTGGTADVALLDVNAQLGKELKPLALANVSGRFGGSQSADEYEFNTQGLSFDTPDGLRWPGGNLALVHRGNADPAQEQTELKADRLDLAALARIANRLPLSERAHAMVDSYAPKGLVESVEARWQGPVALPATYAAKGRVSGLDLASLSLPSVVVGTTTHATPGRPGLEGAAIDFDFTHTGGKAQVRIASGALEFPGIFEEPRIPIDRLSTDVQWKQDGSKLDVQLKNLRFANADAEGEANAGWHTTEVTRQTADSSAARRDMGVLDLQGSLSRGNGARVHRYLPMVLPTEVRHYVRDAVTEGELSEVKFKVKGAVDHIPYTDPTQGDFRITGKVKNGLFAYVPKSIPAKDSAAWPALTGVNGELVFNHASLDILNVSSRLNGLPALQVVKADARIPDLHHAVIDVAGNIRGPLSEAIAFVNASPVSAMTNQALAKAVASGSADYGLQLTLPLATINKSQVRGTVSLPGNDVQFMPGTPLLGKLRGVTTFSETGFNVVSAQAKLLGGDVRFDGGMKSAPHAAGSAGSAADTEPTASFKAQGTLNAEGLRQAKELGLPARIAQQANGNAAYSATLAFRRGVAEVSFATNLQGMALSLPAPLSKSADSVLPVRYESTLVRESLAAGQKLQDQLSLNIGRLASVNYVRDLSSGEPRVVKGSVAVGLEGAESAPMPDSGVLANINMAVVDVDAWEKILNDSGAAASVPPAASAGRGAAPNTAASALQTYLPNQIAIRAKELTVEGRRLSNVVVGGSRDGLNWRANIDATELNGYVEFRQANFGGAAGPGSRVFARLSRLSLGQSSANEVEAILDEQPASIPALDIAIDDLELRGKKLGRVEVEAVNRIALATSRDGAVREWRLNKFNITLPEATLTATGNWVAVNALGAPVAGGSRPRPGAEKRRTVMNFRLDILDSGELLKRFGMNDVIRRGRGKMEGQIAWIGSPLSLDYPTMNGQFNVNIEAGQFLKADPGIAKLLGVLSLQSLPRRLTLDFRDVFSQGFAFDFVRGDVNITQGLAATNNLQMKGVNAAVLMEGNADIAKETQDLTVVVIPEINAGTASLIATVINPAVGLGTFLAQVFFRQPLIRAATQEFHITGTWTDPKINKVDRK